MICPNCNKEMVKGYIPAVRGAVLWIPEEVKMPWGFSQAPKGGFTLSKTTMWKTKKKDAYHCPRCETITMTTHKQMD